jgi:hypothetical protein
VSLVLARARRGPGDDRAHRLRTIGRIGLEQGGDLRAQLFRQPGQVGHVPACRHGAGQRVAHVERLARRGEREDQAEAVDVGAPVDDMAEQAELFGCGERHLAGEALADHGRQIALQLRDPEIDDLGLVELAARKDDVLRREVAVDHALLVGMGEARGQARAQPPHLGDGERPVAHDLGERRAVDELHRQIGQARLGDERAFVGDDRRIAQLAQRRALAAEELLDLGIAHRFGPHRLDGDGVAAGKVGRAVDLAHAADGEQPFDPMRVVEHRAGRELSTTGARLDEGHAPRRAVAARCGLRVVVSHDRPPAVSSGVHPFAPRGSIVARAAAPAPR